MLLLTKKKTKKTNKHFATYPNNNLIKSLMKMKTIVRSGILVIAQGNVVGLLIRSVAN